MIRGSLEEIVEGVAGGGNSSIDCGLVSEDGLVEVVGMLKVKPFDCIRFNVFGLPIGLEDEDGEEEEKD